MKVKHRTLRNSVTHCGVEATVTHQRSKNTFKNALAGYVLHNKMEEGSVKTTIEEQRLIKSYCLQQKCLNNV